MEGDIQPNKDAAAEMGRAAETARSLGDQMKGASEATKLLFGSLQTFGSTLGQLNSDIGRFAARFGSFIQQAQNAIAAAASGGQRAKLDDGARRTFNGFLGAATSANLLTSALSAVGGGMLDLVVSVVRTKRELMGLPSSAADGLRKAVESIPGMSDTAKGSRKLVDIEIGKSHWKEFIDQSIHEQRRARRIAGGQTELETKIEDFFAPIRDRTSKFEHFLKRPFTRDSSELGPDTLTSDMMDDLTEAIGKASTGTGADRIRQALEKFSVKEVISGKAGFQVDQGEFIKAMRGLLTPATNIKIPGFTPQIMDFEAVRDQNITRALGTTSLETEELKKVTKAVELSKEVIEKAVSDILTKFDIFPPR